MPETGGLKGEMAPGDAHPYLALFCAQKTSLQIMRARFIVILSKICYSIIIVCVMQAPLQSASGKVAS